LPARNLRNTDEQRTTPSATDCERFHSWTGDFSRSLRASYCTHVGTVLRVLTSYPTQKSLTRWPLTRFQLYYFSNRHQLKVLIFIHFKPLLSWYLLFSLSMLHHVTRK